MYTIFFCYIWTYKHCVRVNYRLIMDRRRNRRQQSKKQQNYQKSSGQNGVYSADRSVTNFDGLCRPRPTHLIEEPQDVEPLGYSNDPWRNSWFWHNYRKVMDWHGRHHIAYWKSRALASEHQNELLLDYVETVNPECSCYETPEPIVGQDDNMNIVDDTLPEEEDGSFVFEVNEEMLTFFEQSIKHKQELKKQREDDERESEKYMDAHNADGMQINVSELVGKHGVAANTVLYGKHASTIITMETSMKLSFERYIDKKKPQFWPNIPLRP